MVQSDTRFPTSPLAEISPSLLRGAFLFLEDERAFNEERVRVSLERRGGTFPSGQLINRLTGKAAQMAAFHGHPVRLFLPGRPAERAPFVQRGTGKTGLHRSPLGVCPGLWLFSPPSQPSFVFLCF